MGVGEGKRIEKRKIWAGLLLPQAGLGRTQSEATVFCRIAFDEGPAGCLAFSRLLKGDVLPRIQDS